jgi:para-nitrobenzyl esterase
VTVVETAAGRIRGVEAEPGVVAFRGIPYALARRFEPPAPVPSWTGEREASAFGPMAPQPRGVLEAAFGLAEWPMSEADCLTLNVWTPAVDAGAPLPTLVWLHGGAFTNGTSATGWYRGDAFARHGCVLVTLNYRLGILGYTHLADLAGERFAGSGNLGLLDQVAALQWVRTNIGAFGGDPERVTVFGESAGGASVLSLLGCPRADGLFSGAIAQSAAFLQLRDRDHATRAAAKLLAALGLDSISAHRLLELPIEALLDAQASTFSGPEAFTAFAPTPDGTVLPTTVAEGMTRHEADSVPLMIGTNRDELYLFTALDGSTGSLDHDGVLKVASRFVMAERASELVDAYARARPGARPGQLAAAIGGDNAFWLPPIGLAEARSHRDASTWSYRFDWATPTFEGLLGACHGLELPFVFQTLHVPPSELFTGSGADRLPLSDAVHGAWTAFASTRHPGWPQYGDRRQTMMFDVSNSVATDPDGDLRRVWEKLSRRDPVRSPQ